MSRLDRATWSDTGYPSRPGAQKHSRTSRAAAHSIGDRRLSDLHQLVLRLFREAGEQGLTDLELQAVGNTDSILRPRRIELVRLGKLKPTGRTRLTGSRRKAEVWTIA